MIASDKACQGPSGLKHELQQQTSLKTLQQQFKMSKLDLVIFGATGFTGKHAVEHLARGMKEFSGRSWGIAGRSKKKLEEVLQEISKKTDANLSGVRVIVADCGDYESLKAMCAQTRVVVNCCGPYRLYGEPVVKAAVECGAHHVDVSGEPQFIELMQIQYDKQARDAGVYVVSACGLDSVPNDMGVIYLEQNFEGTLNSVESYLSSSLPPEFQKEANGYINYGTWESLVHSLIHWDELAPLRKKLYSERMPTFKPKLQKRSPIHRYNNGWCIPFMGADNSIVYRTQRNLYETQNKRPVQFKAYLYFKSLLHVVMLMFFGILLYVMTRTKFTAKLLLDHPRVFSGGFIAKEGPKKEVSQNTRFTVELVGRGWPQGVDVASTAPERTMRAKISALDPGYGFTTLALLMCANTILTEKDKMPTTGGVLTTGAAFSNTSLIKKLQDNNTTFEIIDKK
ncbi:unnamed protein product [Chilo suppressalis]|uniref:Saccharopine dehydrogenase NADP binding domain-containing protein n=1 Tax=Chilo suppressalis TaxID=168631 RepID=A0ABN8ATK6_CHISP|nr:unnamed protein product [Chilo suppressalis]